MLNSIFNQIFQYDKLSILRRDKIQFKVLLQPKDLKCLQPERKEELINQKIFMNGQGNIEIISDKQMQKDQELVE